jgi:helix-turn-helix protein
MKRREDVSSVENRIRSRRQGAGLSQQDLARRCSLTRQAVNAIEAGPMCPVPWWRFGCRWGHSSSLLALRLLRCGEAHAAGTHLWDQVVGEYNVPSSAGNCLGAAWSSSRSQNGSRDSLWPAATRKRSPVRRIWLGRTSPSSIASAGLGVGRCSIYGYSIAGMSRRKCMAMDTRSPAIWRSPTR